jgi:hypothetical protein
MHLTMHMLRNLNKPYPHNYISMSWRYDYHVLGALWPHRLSKQFMQTHGICLCDVSLLCLTGQTTMYVSLLATAAAAAVSSSSTLLWELSLPPSDDGSSLILVKATNSNESYGNTIVLSIFKNVLTVIVLDCSMCGHVFTLLT